MLDSSTVSTLDTQWLSSVESMDHLDALMASEPWTYLPTCIITVRQGAVSSVTWGETLALTADGTLRDPQKLVDAFAGKCVSEVLLFHVDLPADHIQVFGHTVGAHEGPVPGTCLSTWVPDGEHGRFTRFVPLRTLFQGAERRGFELNHVPMNLVACSRATFCYSSVPVFHDINTLVVVVVEKEVQGGRGGGGGGGRSQDRRVTKKVRFLGARTTKKHLAHEEA